MDGDGDFDLLTSASGMGAMAIPFENDGAGGFTPGGTANLSMRNAIFVDAGNDADLDVYMIGAGTLAGDVGIVPGNGSVNLPASPNLAYFHNATVAGRPALWNNDADVDVVLAAPWMGVAVALEFGYPGEPEDYADCDVITDIVVGEFGQGGQLHAVVNCFNEDELLVYRPFADMFNPAEFAGPPIEVGNGPVAMEKCDLNDDGRDDLVVANQLGEDVSILAGDGLGGFAFEDDAPTGPNPVDIECHDVDRDTNPDLIVLEDGGLGDELIRIRRGTGDFGFEVASTELHVSEGLRRDPRALIVRDLDGNESPDFAVALGFTDMVQQQDPAIGVILATP
jgi:hypothetical protein